MATGRSRAENRAMMTDEIRRLGREHLTTYGAAGLSLRAIARDMGVVSSAVYRYVPSRDELLTMLLVEAYTDVADAVDAAADSVDAADRRERLAAAAAAARRWALADPARWALIYGSPVPGYSAPGDRTIGPGTRIPVRLLRECVAAHHEGLLRPDLPSPTTDIAADMDAIRDEFDLDTPAAVLAAATTLWAVLVGAISLETFGQYGADTFAHPEQLFRFQIEQTLSGLFA
ncbi:MULTISPECIES: TetR/AcrR family transcriptional regulator [Gordonia]|uniref:TetR family transcriptional regulator n=1 Tax=Gordonia terrae TaxID=2055 RepID=A0A2I1RBM1_9ACTN|nr:MULTISPECIES: TetR/AcrR family transcriptional regulator [Gordonia]MCG7632447.1 TetR/AcrR family transcriptional regulator [Gordonia sp. McavH-238-E]PKZ66542.1 TetR family transcriptional regulator [Gordonia terrae]UPW07392.1 TetR/AcrR family transcriptional regulator [Gordonia terrae]